jgi:hypothetical protein
LREHTKHVSIHRESYDDNDDDDDDDDDNNKPNINFLERSPSRKTVAQETPTHPRL